MAQRPAAEEAAKFVEGIGAPFRLARTLAGLNLRHSRKYWPKSPSFADK